MQMSCFAFAFISAVSMACRSCCLTSVCLSSHANANPYIFIIYFPQSSSSSDVLQLQDPVSLEDATEDSGVTGMLSGSSVKKWRDCEPLREKECVKESGCVWMYSHRNGGECLETRSAKGEALLNLEAAFDDAPAPYYQHYERTNLRGWTNQDQEREFEEASDLVLESDVTAEEAGSGVYLRASSGSGSSRHGRRCRPPFPNCGNNSRCMPRTGGRNPICVDNNKCIPSGVVITGSVRPGRCCNGSDIDEHAWTLNPYGYIIYCL